MIKLFRITLSALLLMLVGTTALTGASSVRAQGNCQTFKETGKSVCDKFLTYWNEHGGLRQQGYPISGEFQEVSDVDGKTYTLGVGASFHFRSELPHGYRNSGAVPARIIWVSTPPTF